MMETLRVLAARFAALFRKRRLEEGLEEELRSHLEMAVELNLRNGMSPEEARREAFLSFGGVARTKEIYREQRGLPMLETALQDVRYGLRMLSKTPGFTAVAVVSLALGIGANTAIFTLIDAVLLKMLPVRNPQELVLLRWSVPTGNPAGSHRIDGNTWDENGRNLGTSFSYPSFQQIRARNQVFTDVFAFAGLGDHVNVQADGEAGLARGQTVSSNFFSTLGVQPTTGRMFVDTDDRVGASPVCVISDGYWKRRFGRDSSIAGKAIAIAGVPFTIIGVTPPEFFGVQPGSVIDVWVPISIKPLVAPASDKKFSDFFSADYWWVLVMGRLRPGVSERQAAAGLDMIFKQSITLDAQPDVASPPAKKPMLATLELVPASQGLDQLRRQFSRPLFILMGIVGLVLLIACANVANLLLARAKSRQKEIGVRLSLGASRGRLIRQLLTESALLACLGGALGLALAYWGSGLLLTFISPANNRLSLNLSPDFRVLGFTAVVCLLTGLLFGLAPAWRATRVELTPALKQSTSNLSAGRLRLGWAKTLVIAQAALSLVLLFGAGLFVRTLVNLKNLDTGFNKDNLLLFGLNPRDAGYKGQALNDFYARVQQRIASLPGVVSATSSLHLLLSGSSRGNSIWVSGYSPKPEERLSVRVVPAGSKFFETMKIPLLRGRDFSDRDNESAPKVAVVNQTLVNRYFANRDPIGQRIGWDRTSPDMEIIGVVKDAKYDSLRRDAPATVYHPFRQAINLAWMHYEVRTARDPKALIPDIRSTVAALDRNVPLFDLKTQAEQVDELLLQERLFAKLSSFFGLLALLLACVGLYGIMSYAVIRRTSEIGIRMALGARRGEILGMVLRETLVLVTIGIAVGIPASLMVTRFAASVFSGLLFGLKTTDVTTVAIASLLLMAVAAFAGFLPARRASRVEPTVALRYE
jgi:predicted permease